MPTPVAQMPPAAPETPVRDHLARLGRLIRQARSGTYSIEKLAARAGISAGMISQIERGRANPSFMTLYKLADALDLRIGDLLLDPRGDGGEPRMVVRAHERKRLQIGERGLVYELLTPDLGGRLEMLRTHVPPGFDNEGQAFQHVGEECVHLLTGTLEVTVGDDTFQLREGDSITYDASKAHWWRNSSGTTAHIIGAVTPPSF